MNHVDQPKSKPFDFTEFENDPQYKAEAALLNLTEAICEKWGQYRGKYRVYYRILEWTAEKLIWRGDRYGHK